ncbi:MAG: hypothetical protein ACKVYV_13590 [Limisphaerales bacterium]
MKSAYELAMDRLQQQSPTVALNDAQKRGIAELESQYKAKLAQREIALEGEAEAALAAGDFDKAGELRQQLAHERKKLGAELEEKKERVRRGGK